MAKYRKLYLARIHKDMLRNIVSGADKERTQYTYDTTTPLVGQTMRGNSVLTTSAMKSATLSTLGQEFDKAYTDAFTNAIVKGEGATVTMSNTSASPKLSKYVLNRTQVEMAQKMGMTPWEFAKKINGGQL